MFGFRATVEEKSGADQFLQGPYILDPNHWHTSKPWHKPGSLPWPGAQLDNGVSDKLSAPNFVGYNPFLRTKAQNERVLLSNGGNLLTNQPGPALLAAIEAMIA